MFNCSVLTFAQQPPKDYERPPPYYNMQTGNALPLASSSGGIPSEAPAADV